MDFIYVITWRHQGWYVLWNEKFYDTWAEANEVIKNSDVPDLQVKTLLRP